MLLEGREWSGESERVESEGFGGPDHTDLKVIHAGFGFTSEKGASSGFWAEGELNLTYVLRSYFRYYTEIDLVALEVKNTPANTGDIRDTGSIPGSGRSLEEEMSTHTSIFAWRIPWTEMPVGLQSIGLQRVGHDWTSWELLQTSRGEMRMVFTKGECWKWWAGAQCWIYF